MLRGFGTLYIFYFGGFGQLLLLLVLIVAKGVRICIIKDTCTTQTLGSFLLLIEGRVAHSKVAAVRIGDLVAIRMAGAASLPINVI